MYLNAKQNDGQGLLMGGAEQLQDQVDNCQIASLCRPIALLCHPRKAGNSTRWEREHMSSGRYVIAGPIDPIHRVRKLHSRRTRGSE